MKVVAILAVLGLSAPFTAAAQQRPDPGRPLAPQATDRIAEAYDQFLRAHMFEQDEKGLSVRHDRVGCSGQPFTTARNCWPTWEPN